MKHSLFLTAIALVAAAADPQGKKFPGKVGDRIGARLIENLSDDTPSFWVAVGVAGPTHNEQDEYNTVSTSLWWQGTWSPEESAFAAAVFAHHCSSDGDGRGLVLVDIAAAEKHNRQRVRDAEGLPATEERAEKDECLFLEHDAIRVKLVELSGDLYEEHERGRARPKAQLGLLS